MATAAIAHFAVSLQSQHLPPAVSHAATRSLYNWIGCAIGGATHPTTLKAARALAPFFGPPTATVLGHGEDTRGSEGAGLEQGSSDRPAGRADAQHAALLNGIASHVHDYDDTHLATIIHPTGPVASALLAAAQLPGIHISGPAFLAAFTAGVEVECKLGLAVWPDHYDVGWHITSTVGSVGAAVAVGKALGLGEEEMRHAVGVAATQVVGLRDMFGSDTKSFHPGRAAQCGLLAAVLAPEGWTSSEGPIEAKRGWAKVVSRSERLEEVVVEGLSRISFDSANGSSTDNSNTNPTHSPYEWELLKNAFKPFPCGIVCHPAIDACIQLRQDLLSSSPSLDLTSPDADLASLIQTLDLRVHPLVLELTAKRTPRDGLEAKFSVFHGCAVGLLYGRAGPSQYADEVVRDPAVIAVRDKITASAEVEGKEETVAADAAHAILHLSDGRTLSRYVAHAVGSVEQPMTDAQLEDKFVDQCGLVLGAEGARKASKVAWGIGGVMDVREVAGML